MSTLFVGKHFSNAGSRSSQRGQTAGQDGKYEYDSQPDDGPKRGILVTELEVDGAGDELAEQNAQRNAEWERDKPAN